MSAYVHGGRKGNQNTPPPRNDAKEFSENGNRSGAIGYAQTFGRSADSNNRRLRADRGAG